MNSSSKCRPHCGRPHGVDFMSERLMVISRLCILVLLDLLTVVSVILTGHEAPSPGPETQRTK